MSKLTLFAMIASFGSTACHCHFEPRDVPPDAGTTPLVTQDSAEKFNTENPIHLVHKTSTPRQAVRPKTAINPPPENVDLKQRPLPKIFPGTTIDRQVPPKGWTHIVLVATPGLKPQDLKAAGALMKTALHYTQMFKFVILGKVTSANEDNRKRYYLYTIGRGFSMDISGKEIVVSSDKTFGGNVGRFGPRILAENEKILDKEVKQVARTYNMMMFDAQAVLLRNQKHEKMIMRHAILVDPNTGKLTTFVWLMTTQYQPAEQVLQKLAPNFRENRVLSVKKEKFVFGIPTRDALALVQIPQGTAIRWTADLFRLANQSTYTGAQVHQLQQKLLVLASGK